MKAQALSGSDSGATSSQSARETFPGTRDPITLNLPSAVQREMLHASLASWPMEACGLLVGQDRPGKRNVMGMVPSRNCAEERHSRAAFQIDPGAWIRAERLASEADAEVLCIWHSHPSGGARPSPKDWSGDPGFGWHVLIAIPGVGPPSLWAWRRDADAVRRVPIRSKGRFSHEFQL